MVEPASSHKGKKEGAKRQTQRSFTCKLINGRSNMSYDFNHYPDMDHDGDRDLKDSAMFHDMMEEDERSNSYSSYKGGGGNNASTKSILILLGNALCQ